MPGMFNATGQSKQTSESCTRTDMLKTRRLLFFPRFSLRLSALVPQAARRLAAAGPATPLLLLLLLLAFKVRQTPWQVLM